MTPSLMLTQYIIRKHCKTRFSCWFCIFVNTVNEKKENGRKKMNAVCWYIHWQAGAHLLWCIGERVIQIASHHIDSSLIKHKWNSGVLYSHILSVCRVHGCCIAVAPEDNEWRQDVQRGIKLPQKTESEQQRKRRKVLKLEVIAVCYI